MSTSVISYRTVYVTHHKSDITHHITLLRNTSHHAPRITHCTSHSTHCTSHISQPSHKISFTCRKCGLASAKPEDILSDKYIDGLTQCCWIKKKNRIVMTGSGSMARDAAYDSFKLSTPVISRWNTTIPAMILQNKTRTHTHTLTCIA